MAVSGLSSSSWQAALAQLEALQAAEAAKPAPKGLPGWSPIFIQYFQVLRLLTDVRQAATEPRLCDALAAVIQACAGRVQELHFHLVKLNGGKDLLDLNATLVELKLPATSLEPFVPCTDEAEQAQKQHARAAFIAMAAAQQGGDTLVEQPPEQEIQDPASPAEPLQDHGAWQPALRRHYRRRAFAAHLAATGGSRPVSSLPGLNAKEAESTAPSRPDSAAVQAAPESAATPDATDAVSRSASATAGVLRADSTAAVSRTQSAAAEAGPESTAEAVPDSAAAAAAEAAAEPASEADEAEGLSADLAATRIQAAVRGMLSRRRHNSTDEQDELVFLGMVPAAHPQRQAWEAASEAVTATVSVQKSQWAGKRADAVVKAMAHVQEMERPGMLSGIKDQAPALKGGRAALIAGLAEQITQWYRSNRGPEGELPDMPEEEDGGSRKILNPIAPPPQVAEAAGKGGKAAAKPAAAKPAAAPAKGKGPAVPAVPAPTAFVAPITSALEGLRNFQSDSTTPLQAPASAPLQQSQGQPAATAGSAPSGAPLSMSLGHLADPEEDLGLAEVNQLGGEPEWGRTAGAGSAGSAFVARHQANVGQSVSVPIAHSSKQQQADRIWADMARAQVRPLVKEDARLQADREMRVLVQQLKEEAEAKLAEAKKAAGGSAKGKKGAKDKKPGSAKGEKGGKKPGSAKGGKKGAKKAKPVASKDPTANKSLESLAMELVVAGVLYEAPKATFQAYMGGPQYARPKVLVGEVEVPGSMAAVRTAVMLHGVLPLVAPSAVRALMPLPASLMFYGLEGTGKSLLSHALAAETGAAWFDISPRVTDGKWPGKLIGGFLAQVFKVAKAMAPSIVYIDDVDKIFVSDKKRAKLLGGVEPYNRIKKDLLKQVATLEPQDRVLLLSNAREPTICVKKDADAIKELFAARVLTPLPSQASCSVLWKTLIANATRQPVGAMDFSTLASVSQGYAPSAMQKAVSAVLTPERLQQLKSRPLQAGELAAQLTQSLPCEPAAETALADWHFAPPTPPPDPSAKDAKGEKKK